jgi:hypothetical protein
MLCEAFPLDPHTWSWTFLPEQGRQIRMLDEWPAAEVGFRRASFFDEGPQTEDVLNLFSLAAEIAALFKWKAEREIEAD